MAAPAATYKKSEFRTATAQMIAKVHAARHPDHRGQGPAKAVIQLQEVKYASAFRYNETTKSYCREHNSYSPQYVETPNKEVDNARAELFSWQYLVLSEEEVQELEDPVAIRGFYLAE
ncbi:hypothetical protein ONS95_010291 [Cadophora gregata]|uniref:uncharacterized protein n=1 Tax=Cadophora gregata TaxID=51156 RepID=UPI0026DBA5AF|nr:uncharacterized protein ONS95_010291 [Cadophora gregata]KAK0122027.1 hypothetical protein ONS95_010291 [Cadophora gregata]KAK0127503.1 hypothetical protein ONS96_007038 [Cadophora gregata f. sp. sojae]